MKKRLLYLILLATVFGYLLAGCQSGAPSTSSQGSSAQPSSSAVASERSSSNAASSTPQPEEYEPPKLNKVVTGLSPEEYSENGLAYSDYDYEKEQEAFLDLDDRICNPQAQNPLALPEKRGDISQTGILVNDITPNTLSGQQAQYAVKSKQYMLLAQHPDGAGAQLALYDLAGNLLYEYFPPEGRRIRDIALTERYAYVLETDDTTNSLGDNWAVLCLDLSSLSLNSVIDAKDPPRNFTPHITAYGDDLLFFGVDSNDKLLLYRYFSQNGKIQELLGFHTFISLWDPPTVCGDSMVFYDYDEDGWYVLIYHLEENTIDKYYPTFEYSTEYINAAFAQGDHIAYRTSLGLLYVMNTKTGQIDLVDNESLAFTVKDNKLVYTSSSYEILVYDMESKNNYLVERRESGFSYGYFTQANGHVLVPGVHQETREGIVLEIVV